MIEGYDFTGVLEQFAERGDWIVLLFGAQKLDISEELKRPIEALCVHDDKIRVILNKANMVDHRQISQSKISLMIYWGLQIDSSQR